MKKNNKHNKAKELKRQKKKQQREQNRKKNPHKFIAGSEPTAPTWVYDLMGNLTNGDIRKLRERVNESMNMLRLWTYDNTYYSDMLFAMRHFHAFSKKFDSTTKNELLATMGTAAIHAIHNLVDEVRAGKPKKEAAFKAMFEPLDHAVSTYYEMMSALYRSEHEYARREAYKMNLTKALTDVAIGGVSIIFPDETDEDKLFCGVHGVAYVHGRCEAGYISRINDVTYWTVPETQTLIRIDKPTLMFMVEKRKDDGHTEISPLLSKS